MQARQDAGECEFVIHGISDWRSCLTATIALDGGWAELCGGTEVPIMTYLEKEAELNGHSLERSIVHAFLRLGYKLEELEVDIDGNKDEGTWGRCVWYPEHVVYEQSLPDMFDRTAINNPAYYFAMFRTEHAGDQVYGLYSMQMMMSTSTLFHKTLLYRKVVFSPPKAVEQEAAA